MEKPFPHITCAVCFKPYKDPRILPCLHSFCLQCLHHEIGKSGSQQMFQCPICERNTSIPVGGASGLPQNLHLGFEVEVAGYMSKMVNNSDVACDHCIDGGNGPAVVFCCTCHQFLCKVAYEYHRTDRHLSKHNMVGLDQEGARQLHNTKKSRDHYCSQPNHGNNNLNFYCETCSLLVCLHCTTATHKTHTVKDISTVAKTLQIEITGALEDAREVVTKLTGAMDENNRMIEQVEISKINASLAINNAFETLQQTLEERKKILLSELEAISLSKTTALTLQKEQFEKMVGDIGHYSDMASQILHTHIEGGNGPAVVFCCTCHQFLCKECHRTGRHFSKHNTVGLDQEGARQLHTTKKPRDHYCSQPSHGNNSLNFYCETCSLLVCLHCTTVAHKSHTVKEISTVAKTLQIEITGALEDAKNVVTKLTGAMDENNRMIGKVEISKRNASLAIIKAFETLEQTLEERKKTLLSELEAISLSKTTALTLQKEQFEKMVGDIGHYTDMASQILQTHTDHEIVALGGLIPTELQATLKRVQTISLTPNQLSNITVSVQTDDLIRQLSKFGNVLDFYPSPSSSTWTSTSVAKVGTRYRVKVQSKTSKGEEYPHGGIEVKGEMRSKTHNGAVVYGEVEDHRDGTYTITLTPQTAGPHQLLITMDGQHVQNSPNDRDVRPKRDYRILCNAQQMIQCNEPKSVAIHDNGDIYVVSDDGCIYVFDQTGQLKNTIGSSGSGDGQFSYPSGISIKGDVLYVADSSNNRVQKLTSSGKFLHKFGQKGSGQGQFNRPWGVIIDSNNKLIVSDYDNHRIQIFNEDGGWLLTIDGKGSGNHRFYSPSSLALDPQGNIRVASWGSHTIKVFTKEGVYVRMYGDPNSPTGIAIDDEGYSLVSECWGNCLSIYDPEGNKIHTVGNLKNPYGTALDPRDGSVFIANYGADTVLKYCV